MTGYAVIFNPLRLADFLRRIARRLAVESLRFVKTPFELATGLQNERAMKKTFILIILSITGCSKPSETTRGKTWVDAYFYSEKVNCLGDFEFKHLEGSAPGVLADLDLFTDGTFRLSFGSNRPFEVRTGKWTYVAGDSSRIDLGDGISFHMNLELTVDGQVILMLPQTSRQKSLYLEANSPHQPHFKRCEYSDSLISQAVVSYPARQLVNEEDLAQACRDNRYQALASKIYKIQASTELDSPLMVKVNAKEKSSRTVMLNTGSPLKYSVDLVNQVYEAGGTRVDNSVIWLNPLYYADQKAFLVEEVQLDPFCDHPEKLKETSSILQMLDSIDVQLFSRSEKR